MIISILGTMRQRTHALRDVKHIQPLRWNIVCQVSSSSACAYGLLHFAKLRSHTELKEAVVGFLSQTYVHQIVRIFSRRAHDQMS